MDSDASLDERTPNPQTADEPATVTTVADPEPHPETSGVTTDAHPPPPDGDAVAEAPRRRDAPDAPGGLPSADPA